MQSYVFLMFLSLIAYEVQAQDINELLRQTDQALGRGNNEDSPKPKARPKAKKSQEDKSRPEEKNAQGTDAGKKTPDGVLTPTDADSVQELIGISASPEAQIQADRRDQDLSISVGYAKFRGRAELSKDDDTFRLKPGTSLMGVRLDYSVELASTQWKPLVAAGVAYLRGKVTVERSGVQNGEITPDDTNIPMTLGLGPRYQISESWRTSLTYGPSFELLIQTGTGDSDSTSGSFITDQIYFSVERSLAKSLKFTFNVASRGIFAFQENSAGQDMVSMGLQFPL
jgi:hypothetical protein